MTQTRNAPPDHGAPDIPLYDALVLTGDGREALICLGSATYRLSITRAGKLILTK